VSLFFADNACLTELADLHGAQVMGFRAGAVLSSHMDWGCMEWALESRCRAEVCHHMPVQTLGQTCTQSCHMLMPYLDPIFIHCACNDSAS
jgi:hypothetical protein